MFEEGLGRRAKEALQHAIAKAGAIPGLKGVHRELLAAKERIHQPMRVAIAGLIKAGKSTLMNALLGERIVPTGTAETTYNVNWMKHGESPGLRVHFKDGRLAEPRPFDDLAVLTRRCAEALAALEQIEYLEVLHPNPLLRRFELIDLPGLASFYQGDSRNARGFLRLHGKRLTAITQEGASQADAVLYLFSRGVHGTDRSVVEELQGPALGRANPINSIGVLTKVDAYWPHVEEPLEAGRQITSRLMVDRPACNLFYAAEPVCGLLAEGAVALQAEDLGILERLARLPQERFARLIGSVDRFAGRAYPDVPVTPEERRRVLMHLGLYGVHLACRLLRQGECSLEEVPQALIERSGVSRLRDLVLAHFGKRALLIQLEAALLRLKAVCFAERQRLEGQEQKALAEIAGALEAFELREPAFRELQVLRDLYRGKLEFTEDERREVLAMTGEKGLSPGARLGPDGEGGPRQLAKVAGERASYWQARAQRPSLASPETLSASRLMARAYDALASRLESAADLLDSSNTGEAVAGVL